ncbi:hypothetical protein EK21DRAFT_108165 [Setomelanomma holmii]|uniref:Uncharacterized protein n=1 Tax=Setomelanomma holmii TaxID=210430 RepID=A0A9P4HGG0_9PLEO|nr:hypothetical protein EK21DRAFT_108165 [Setomelanomma holmii]
MDKRFSPAAPKKIAKHHSAATELQPQPASTPDDVKEEEESSSNESLISNSLSDKDKKLGLSVVVLAIAEGFNAMTATALVITLIGVT